MYLKTFMALVVSTMLGNILSGCVPITPQDSVVGSVRVRIYNSSVADFDSVDVNFSNETVSYGSVPAGEYSQYLAIETAYRYAQITIRTGEQEFLLQPIDYVGEIPLTAGDHTYNLDVEDNQVLLQLAGPEIAADSIEPPGLWTIETLYVGANEVDCVGVAPQKCLQVRATPDGEWELFYDQIVDFSYEPGYEYELLVRVVEVEDPPADASALRYELLQIIDKSEAIVAMTDASPTNVDPVEPAVTLEGNTWTLQVVNASTNSTPNTSSNEMADEITVQFVDGKVSGSAGCNRYFGAYRLDGDSVGVSDIGTTRMACDKPVMEQEQEFLETLSGAQTVQLEADLLKITSTEGVLFFGLGESTGP